MIIHLDEFIIRIIESFVSKKSNIVILKGKTPLITRLYDLNSMCLGPYIFDRDYLSRNPSLVYLLEKGLNHIDWRLLSKDIYKIDYIFLRTRPQNALGRKKQDDALLLFESRGKVDWDKLDMGIFAFKS